MRENKFSCVGVNFFIVVPSQIGYREERGHIGVIHEIVMSKAIHLKGIYFTKLRVFYYGMFLVVLVFPSLFSTSTSMYVPASLVYQHTLIPSSISDLSFWARAASSGSNHTSIAISCTYLRAAEANMFAGTK